MRTRPFDSPREFYLNPPLPPRAFGSHTGMHSNVFRVAVKNNTFLPARIRQSGDALRIPRNAEMRGIFNSLIPATRISCADCYAEIDEGALWIWVPLSYRLCRSGNRDRMMDSANGRQFRSESYEWRTSDLPLGQRVNFRTESSVKRSGKSLDVTGVV
jgi:hypothetical protein